MNTRGFTLVEVLVSIVIISLGAMLAFSVTKIVSQKQVQARDAMQYISASNSIKSAFEEYLYSRNFDGASNGLIEDITGVYKGNDNCKNYAENSIGRTKFLRNICLIEENLTKITVPNKTYYKRIDVRVSKSTSNDVHYFTGRISIVNAYDENQIYFERLFVNQITVGSISNQSQPPCLAPCGTPFDKNPGGGIAIGLPVLNPNVPSNGLTF